MSNFSEKPNSETVFFVTSNMHKYHEIQAIFRQHSPMKLKLQQTALLEIQTADLEENAAFSLKQCNQKFDNNLIFVEDSGLFIHRLNGFPGPYSAYVFDTLGLRGIMNLMRNIEDRKAFFQSTIALKIKNQVEIFTERVKGRISLKISDTGWGYDPIFIPNSDGCLTFGELGKKKNYHSHRYLATLRLIDFLTNY
ncbi:MAG: non-canonical purine NTP pyrophosphatase [Candidatus Hodarchaeales archaeon]|jgi:XTP/dITP diphosphohydrolase